MLKRRGRPLGFRLSEATKMAISIAKLGQHHKEETKDKISMSLIAYFRRRKPLSDEIINTYCRSNDDTMCDWIMSVRTMLDDSNEIKTYRAMINSEIYERRFMNEVETVSHNITPELLLLFKEHCELNNIELEEGCDSL